MTSTCDSVWKHFLSFALLLILLLLMLLIYARGMDAAPAADTCFVCLLLLDFLAGLHEATLYTLLESCACDASVRLQDSVVLSNTSPFRAHSVRQYLAIPHWHCSFGTTHTAMLPSHTASSAVVFRSLGGVPLVSHWPLHPSAELCPAICQLYPATTLAVSPHRP